MTGKRTKVDGKSDDAPPDADLPGLPRRASLADTLRVARDVLGVTIAKGIFIRRYGVVALAARAGLDRRAVMRMADLRRRYGPGPLVLRVPFMPQAIVLDHAQVGPLLERAPRPFMPASDEKRAALAHFEPDVALASRGAARERRRALNDQALESDRPTHSCADRFGAVIEEEIGTLAGRSVSEGTPLDWSTFQTGWNRTVRRIVLGNGATDDDELTALLDQLRRAGNWAMLRPRRTRLLRRFQDRLAGHLERAEAGSLAAALMARGGREAMAADPTPGGEATDQVTHWLFAADPGGMATFRALALLATHSDALDGARGEIGDASPDPSRSSVPPSAGHLRAAILESLRLWPTTPAILRETVRDVEWGGRTMRAGTNLTVLAPWHHRDPALPHADSFQPALWLGSDGRHGSRADQSVETVNDVGVRGALVPFSAGPATCPAHHLVPLLGALALAAMLRRRTVELLEGASLRRDRPLPATLDNAALAFRLAPHPS